MRYEAGVAFDGDPLPFDLIYLIYALPLVNNTHVMKKLVVLRILLA